tara:strand:+ start:473 stop:706 length:234 start_codon:yes stop_codon:yes gene_type:complete
MPGKGAPCRLRSKASPTLDVRKERVNQTAMHTAEQVHYQHRIHDQMDLLFNDSLVEFTYTKVEGRYRITDPSISEQK